MPDTKAPLILSGPKVLSITDTTATIEWQTNEPAKGSLVYGTALPPSTTLNELAFKSLHSMPLTGLTGNTTYYVQVTATDASNNGPTTSQIVSFTTMPIPDTTAPVILTGPTVSRITHNSAVVEWTTNEPSTGSVVYGLTSTPDQTLPDSTLATTHRVTLTGLTPETLYYLNVTATDAANNGPTSSPVVTFRTIAVPDTIAPLIIEGPMAINITDTSATIVWKTDEPATSCVSWNNGTAYGVYTDDTLTTNHSVQVTGLTASTLYNYAVSSKDAAGNGPTLSATKTFRTLQTPDTKPPVFTESPMVINITHQSAVIRWKSDEPSDSLIEFGTTPSFGSSEGRAELVTNHNIPLTGLAAGTPYYFRVSSKDAAGNGTVSATYTFTTDPKPSGKKAAVTQAATIIGSTDTTATIYWETDLPADTVVTYGQGSTLTNQVADGAKVNKHQATITNLQPNATYSLVISSTDMDGNTVMAKAGRPVTFLASSDSFGFTPTVGFLTNSLPDTTAPVIVSGPVVSNLGSNGAVITWTTDEISDSQLYYGLSTGSMTMTVGEITPVTSHSLTITNLQPSTTYYVKANSTDPSGNGPTTSGTISFTTSPVDVTPPTITEFTVPASTATLTVNGITFSAVDASGVTGYCLTGSNDSTGCTWFANAPTSYTLSDGTPDGVYDIYAFAKDTLGNVTSASTVSFMYGVVGGVCGSSNGGTYTTAPTSNLCSVGVATTVTGTGPWDWTCNGANGGSNASCAAGIQTYSISFISGGNGTITGTTPQTINHGSSTASVTAVPAIDYHFVNWTGTGGFVTTTSNPLTVTNVSAAQTITANFVHDPVNGVCGSANGTTVSTIPSTNLCSSGVASAVAGTGPWSWGCDGQYGGSTASCATNPFNLSVSVTIAGSGSGTVNSAVNGESSGFNCGSGTCSTSIPASSKVELFASPSSNSLFGGWSIGCSGTGTCTINPLIADTGVTALFTINHKIKLNGTSVLQATLQDAYNAANDGETFLIHADSFSENLNFNLPKNVKLWGGKDSGYLNTIGVTTIQGSINIEDGSVEIRDVVIW